MAAAMTADRPVLIDVFMAVSLLFVVLHVVLDVSYNEIIRMNAV
jgi:hypothetical protein